jgi:hypothetical protein
MGKPPSLERDVLQALMVTMAIGSLFNSLLLAVNAGRFFAVMLGLLLAGVANRARPCSFALHSLGTGLAPHRRECRKRQQ